MHNNTRRLISLITAAIVLTPVTACVNLPSLPAIPTSQPVQPGPALEPPAAPPASDTPATAPGPVNGPAQEPKPEPSKPPAPEPPKPRQGTYRITVNGFIVKSQTKDHQFEDDGKGDEVYVDIRTKVIDKDGNEKDNWQNTTATMGDTNRQVGRVQAGSAFGKKGGIVKGDNIPGAKPWALLGDPTPDQLPLNGGTITLTEGQDKALITPTIWEWDGGSDLFTQFTHWFDKAAENVPAEALGPAAAAAKKASSMNLGEHLSSLFGVAGDRPVGIHSQNRDGYAFDPQVISLDYAVAEMISASDTGKGLGVRLLTFKDAPQFEGHYELFYQVTKVS